MDVEGLLKSLRENRVRFVIIAMKKAAGRAKDLEDLKAFVDLRRRRRGKAR